MNLSKSAIELIDKFKDSPWFVAVGNPLEDETAVSVESWAQAMELCLSDDWEDTRWDAENGLTGVLDRDHCDRYQEWNDIIDAINSQLLTHIKSIAKKTIKEHGLPSDFSQFMIHTTRLACMEAQYSDILAPGFFSEMGSWYLVGHLPCGLTGKFPDGKLLVF